MKQTLISQQLQINNSDNTENTDKNVSDKRIQINISDKIDK